MPDEAEAERIHDEQSERGKEVARSRKATGGGGKLSRSETVTVRLDPKLNYLCELAARAQRRTKSSFIEWAIDNALKSVLVPGKPQSASVIYTIASEAERLWDVDEADRLAQLAFWAPVLMTHEEQLIWKLVEDCGLLWAGNYSEDPPFEWQWGVGVAQLRWSKYREHFQTFKDVVNGVKTKADLPRWLEQKVRERVERQALDTFETDLDSDIPF